MAKKETFKDYLNKCQFLQREGTFATFTIQVYPLTFEVTLSVIDKNMQERKYSFRFRKNSSEKELEDEYKLLLLVFKINKYDNDFIQN